MIRLKSIREKRGMSQIELSATSGVSQSMLSDIENGKSSPTVKILTKLAIALGVRVSELLGEEQPAKEVG